MLEPSLEGWGTKGNDIGELPANELREVILCHPYRVRVGDRVSVSPHRLKG